MALVVHTLVNKEESDNSCCTMSYIKKLFAMGSVINPSPMIDGCASQYLQDNVL